MTAIQAGFTSVMMDGSLKADGKTPGDWDYNVGVTKTVTDMAHLGGISVEGELGVLGSLETGMGDKEDGHGAEGKLPRPAADQSGRGGEVRRRDQGRRARHRHGHLARRLQVHPQARRRHPRHARHRGDPPQAAEHHLVMHGSSSVPQDLQEIINQYGGKMKQTWGVPVEEIQRGIKHGVRKINIDTDNRMAMTGQIRKVLSEDPGEFDPRKYLKPRDGGDDRAVQAALRGVQHRRPGLEDQATVSEMAKRYKDGSLDPKFG
jgi:fructose-bisphosphate aldolase class II